MKRVENEDSPFSIEEIEADWSSAAFWYAIAILRHTAIYFPNLKLNSLQGDSILAKWATCWNIASNQIDNGVKIQITPQPHTFQTPQVFDFINSPDLAPILIVLSLLANRECIFSGLQNLNAKESKRKDVILQELFPFADFEMLNHNALRMYNIKVPKEENLSFSSHKDHRFVMAFTLFALYNNVEIDNAEVVKKSYPAFFKMLGK